MARVTDAEPAIRVSEIPAARGRKRLDWSGRFSNRELEGAFRRDTLEAQRRFLRFSVGLASLTFLDYGLHDALVVPEVRDRAWAVRFGVFVPASALSKLLG